MRQRVAAWAKKLKPVCAAAVGGALAGTRMLPGIRRWAGSTTIRRPEARREIDEGHCGEYEHELAVSGFRALRSSRGAEFSRRRHASALRISQANPLQGDGRYESCVQFCLRDAARQSPSRKDGALNIGSLPSRC